MAADKSVIAVTDSIFISESDLEEYFIRASGPGGQNVNKVATAAVIRLNVHGCDSIPSWMKQRIRSLAGKKITREGIVIIKANRFRTQLQNRLDARERLVALLERAAARPAPRQATAPTHASRARRTLAKKRRSALKKRRVQPSDLEMMVREQFESLV